MKFLKVTIVIVPLICVVVGTLLLFRTYLDRQDINNIAISSPISSTVTSNVVQINTDGISVILPNGYTMKVTTGTEGMKYKVLNVSYSGVTKIEILKDNKNVITIAGVSGVGGNTNIKSCFNFEDSDKNFLSQLQENQIKSNIGFKELNLFGETERLTDTNILTSYFPGFSNNGKVFCEPIFHTFKQLIFESISNNKKLQENLYEVDIDSTIPNADIYEILSSLKIQ